MSVRLAKRGYVGVFDGLMAIHDNDVPNQYHIFMRLCICVNFCG